MGCNTCTHKDVCKHVKDYNKANEALENKDIFEIGCKKYTVIALLKPVNQFTDNPYCETILPLKNVFYKTE